MTKMEQKTTKAACKEPSGGETTRDDTKAPQPTFYRVSLTLNDPVTNEPYEVRIECSEPTLVFNAINDAAARNAPCHIQINQNIFVTFRPCDVLKGVTLLVEYEAKPDEENATTSE